MTLPTQSDLVRSRSLIGYRDLVRHLGGNPETLLARFGLEAALGEDGDALFPYTARIHLLEATAEGLKCPDFGLRLAEKQKLDMLGPLALVAQNSKTAAEAVLAVGRSLTYHCSATHIRMDVDTAPHLRRLTFSILVDGNLHRRQSVEQSLGFMLNAFRQLIGKRFTPDHVLLRHESGMPNRLYQHWFSCPVLFCQDVNALVVETSQLDRPIDQSNPDLLRMAEAYVAGEIARRPMDVLGQVKTLVDLLLQTDKCTLEHVAERLRMEKRTLQRRLTSDATTFDAVVDRTRRQRAQEYLAQANVPISQAAVLVGFSEQSSFNKACKRWFGVTPKAVRAASIGGAFRSPANG